MGMKWFIERTLTGIAHMLSSQPGTPELFNFVAILFAFTFLALEIAHWRTFNGEQYTHDCGVILAWWSGARVCAGIGRLIDGGHG
jgi:hypothetical protein